MTGVSTAESDHRLEKSAAPGSVPPLRRTIPLHGDYCVGVLKVLGAWVEAVIIAFVGSAVWALVGSVIAAAMHMDERSQLSLLVFGAIVPIGIGVSVGVAETRRLAQVSAAKHAEAQRRAEESSEIERLVRERARREAEQRRLSAERHVETQRRQAEQERTRQLRLAQEAAERHRRKAEQDALRARALQEEARRKVEQDAAAERAEHERQERQAEATRLKSLAAAEVARWNHVAASAPVNAPGGPTPLACQACAGSGRTTRAKSTVEIRPEPEMETVRCNHCSGTGIGRAAGPSDLDGYLAQPGRLSGEVFDLARTKSSLVAPTDGVLPLLAKAARTTYEGERTDRGGAAEENTETLTQYCLTANGGFLVRTAHHESWIHGVHYTTVDEGWTPWHQRSGVSLDTFMAEFDFTAYGNCNEPGYTSSTHRVEDIGYYAEQAPGRYATLRQVYPEKGQGLIAALLSIG